MKRITFTVSESLHKKIKLRAAEEKTSIRAIAIDLFESYLKRSFKDWDFSIDCYRQTRYFGDGKQ